MAFIPIYILILIFTIVIDYFAGIYIAKTEGKKRKLLLALSIVANISILAVFKYYNFFIENINELFYALGISKVDGRLPYLNIILPIGLSFHTFQAMSYTIEVYRGNQKPERHFGIYALYVMFYPQLVAGPIERPQNLLPQFRIKHEFDLNRVYSGLRLMLWGLFKKVVIADRLTLYVDSVYSNIGDQGSASLIIATLFFAIQIYCDFSGYSDIALGSAQVMGFRLMTNFKKPYFAKNIQEFWKRWHISLSSWFRDYLYFSIGGNRISAFRTYINVIIVFIISGFWHGANYTFIIWGAIHALFIVIFMLLTRYSNLSFLKNKLFNFGSIIFTFLLVCFAWIFFRAPNVNDAFQIISKIFELDFSNFKLIVKDSVKNVEFGMTSMLIGIATIFLLFINDWLQDSNQTANNDRPMADIVYNAFILFLIVSLGVFQKTSFIYFQF